MYLGMHRLACSSDEPHVYTYVRVLARKRTHVHDVTPVRCVHAIMRARRVGGEQKARTGPAIVKFARPSKKQQQCHILHQCALQTKSSLSPRVCPLTWQQWILRMLWVLSHGRRTHACRRIGITNTHAHTHTHTSLRDYSYHTVTLKASCSCSCRPYR